MREYVTIQVPDEQVFYKPTIRCAQIGPVQFQLVQPGEGKSINRDFLEKHGEGVFHLGFVVEDVDAARARVTDLKIDVLNSGRRNNGSDFNYLDTVDKARVTLLLRQSPPVR